MARVLVTHPLLAAAPATAPPRRAPGTLLAPSWHLDHRLAGGARAHRAGPARSVPQVARGAWDRAPRELGLDAETAAACRLRVEEDCDFGTVLDGSEPRFTS